MPTPALPVPRPRASGGRFRRVYVDALGRGMDGTVTVTGAARADDDGRVTLPAPVTLEVVAGLVDTLLPADTYTVRADLRTVDGHRVTDTETVAVAVT